MQVPIPDNGYRMLAARTLFVLSLIGAFGAANALRGANTHRPEHLRPLWLPAMLTAELVPLRVLSHGATVGVLWWFGALEHRIGRIGLALTVATWIGYGVLQGRSARTRRAMEDGLAEVGVPSDGTYPISRLRVATGYPFRVPAGVERIENIEYAPGLHLDLYRNRDRGLRPAVLQVHGGSWSRGNRRQQARPLMHILAERGWITAGVSYPLAPAATFEDQLIALKRAIAWARSDGADYGVDPRFVSVTGGSSGGHLASLLALTPNQMEYQPGFERVDTSVQAAVPFYGIYDMLNRNGTRDEWPVIIRSLMKESKQQAEERYRSASPLDQVGPHAPPFLIVHGTHDSVVGVAEARQFVTALREASRAPVAYVEIPGATHGFDTLYSVRTRRVIDGVERFLRAMMRD